MIARTGTGTLWAGASHPLKRAIGLGFLLLLLVFLKVVGLAGEFPASLEIDLAEPINHWADWFTERFRAVFHPVSQTIRSTLKEVDRFVLGVPWLVVLMAIFMLTWRYAGLGLAFYALFSFLFMGGIGLWDESLVTLNIMALSVVLTVALGIPIGICAALSDSLERILRPVLDAMQTLPIFVYLIPVMMLFGLGSTPAVFATIIYAIPPIIRLTNLGIRQVSTEAVEAARSCGSTRGQLLFKIQIPLAKPAIMMGVNQTVMMALSMVIFVALIGGTGLGKEIWYSMRRLQIGRSVEAGTAVVLMAIFLDRLSLAIAAGAKEGNISHQSGVWMRFLTMIGAPPSAVSACLSISKLLRALVELPADAMSRFLLWVFETCHIEPDRVELRSLMRRQGRTILGCLALLVTLAVVIFGGFERGFPKSWSFQYRSAVDLAIDWMTINLDGITTFIRTVVYMFGLAPMREFLLWLPWPVFVIGTAALAASIAGFRTALFTTGGLMFIGVVGMWSHAMITISQVAVALTISIAIAVPVGVLASRSDRFEALLRPILDTMQTLPAFVYFPLVVFLFRVGELSGIIATVVYAIPPAVRLTNLGLRSVHPETVEAARSFGSTEGQTLYKVKFPLALPTIMMGVNQTTMMALAMVVYAALIGAKGLGSEVMTAIGKFNVGAGFESGLSIVFLAVIVDRITQAWARKRQEALA